VTRYPGSTGSAGGQGATPLGWADFCPVGRHLNGPCGT